jgi:hypothetical protein
METVSLRCAYWRMAYWPVVLLIKAIGDRIDASHDSGSHGLFYADLTPRNRRVQFGDGFDST